MADPDKMSRADLLKAKERVELQLERLSYRLPASVYTYTRSPKTDLVAELTQILDEINAELSETEAKGA
jgi:hypothetical protein